MSCFQKLVSFAWTPVSRRFAQRRSRWIRLPTHQSMMLAIRKRNAILAGELSDTVKEDLTTRVCVLVDSCCLCWREADGTTDLRELHADLRFRRNHPEAIGARMMRCRTDWSCALGTLVNLG